MLKGTIGKVLIMGLIVFLFTNFASAAFIDSPDVDLKNIFQAPGTTGKNISVTHAPDGSGGYLFYSAGIHEPTISISIPKGKLKRINFIDGIIHTDENGKSKIEYIITTSSGNDIIYTMSFSSNCVGCYVGTYSQSYTNKNNSAISLLGQTFNSLNISTITLTQITSVGNRNLSTQRCGVNTTGLVLCMNMDETTGTLVQDYSGMGNNGTWYGNVTINSTTGKYDRAVAFDGVNDYVNIIDSTNIANGTSTFTVSTWIKSNSWVSISGIVGKKPAYSPSWGFTQEDGKFWFYSKGNISEYITSPLRYQNNTWHHIVGVKNSTHLLIFVNNLMVVSQLRNLSNVIDTHGYNITIGTVMSGTGLYFNGSIDEVRIWNRSLNASEIQQNYLVRADYFQAKTNANASYSASWNGSGNLSVPTGSADAVVSNISLLFPQNATIDGVTVYDYVNNTKVNYTVTIGYTENTTTITETSDNGTHITNISILHTNNGTGRIIQAITDSTYLHSSAKSTYVLNSSNNINASVTKNTTHYFINEGEINNSVVYYYNLTDYYNIPGGQGLPGWAVGYYLAGGLALSGALYGAYRRRMRTNQMIIYEWFGGAL